MQTKNPAYNQKELDRKLDLVTTCGKNRGPHYYIPIQWETVNNVEYVSMFMCRVCFTRVSLETLVQNFPEAKL